MRSSMCSKVYTAPFAMAVWSVCVVGMAAQLLALTAEGKYSYFPGM